jgi:hypothetical protein
MEHIHTLETNKQIEKKCIYKDEETDECKDKTEFPKILENLLLKFKTKIKNNDEKKFYLEDNLNVLKTFVKNTDEILGGNNENNTLLDDENIIKEIIEQFKYLIKTPDFIIKIKYFLEKNNIFTTVPNIDTGVTVNKDKNNTFEIKKIDDYDMFISQSESASDKLKKKYYFNISYYKSQAEFEEFKTHLNQLNELKKNYQDLISNFESAIKEFKNKRTNLEKLINTYLKNALSKKREILTKFDNFIKNITKNVYNIKDIPNDLINYLQVKKSNIQTVLIQKSFPHFETLDDINVDTLSIDQEHGQDDNKVDLLENNPTRFKVNTIKDDNNKIFNLEPINKIKQGTNIIFSYKIKNSDNKNYNHKLIITLTKDNINTNNIYIIKNIQAEIDNNIKISYENRGGKQADDKPEDSKPKDSKSEDSKPKDSKPEDVNNNTSENQNLKTSSEIEGLNKVFLNLQKKIDYVIKQKIRDGVDVSGVKSKDIEKGDVGDDIIETLVLDYERKKQNVKSIDEKERIDIEFLEKVNGLGLNLNEIFEVNLMDKFYFILYSLVLHIITYSIIESLIMSSNLNSLVSIMCIYSFLYVFLIILTLGIMHIYGYRGKIYLNYLNLDHNFYNIIGHLIIVAIFFSIILILSQYINTANIENEDERVKMLYRIEIITGVMFAFTSMFILIL